MSTDVDYSLPIADLLRKETAAAHEAAERSEGAGYLTRGELDRDEYVRFLMMLYHVYDTLEQGLERHATHTVLAPTYNPALFNRTTALSEDISYMLDIPLSSWQSHPIHTKLTSHPPAQFSAYTARLRKLGESEPAALLAHAYVRYLGDLSGGQFIRRRIAKAYGLSDGAGTAFYEFKQLGGNGSSTIGDMKKIKEWYRDGMNKGVGDDRELKELVLEEANIAFQLNTGLFATLQPPKNATVLIAPTPVSLGDPQTPVEDVPIPPVVTRQSESGSFPLSSVLAILLAICFSQVFIVFGGFSGEQGSAKIRAIVEKLMAVLSI